LQLATICESASWIPLALGVAAQELNRSMINTIGANLFMEELPCCVGLPTNHHKRGNYTLLHAQRFLQEKGHCITKDYIP
jgi:hypothetical protein